MVINLLSNPRNCSTALMYSFRQHHLIDVIDEPFYARFLSHSGKEHSGREDILQSQVSKLKDILNLIDEQDNIVFLKNMAHHLIDLDWSFLLPWKNVFLIRNPKEMIYSFSKVIEHPTHDDIGIKQQAEIAKFFLNNNHDYQVIDSGELLKNPVSVLKQLFKSLEIPFDQAMLEWPSGPKPEDGVWAKYWYENVHQSTGFQQPYKKEIHLPEGSHDLLEECQYIYNQFYNQSIKA